MRKGLIILADLKDEDLILLSRIGKLREISPRESLISAGQEVQDLFVITEGHFRVEVDGDMVAELATGDVLGEMSFVEKRPPGATVLADGPARVLAIPRELLLREFETNDGFAARFYRALAVFLSDRLRAMTPAQGGEEIDEGLLDTLHVAGDRMIRLIGLLEGETGV
ncbi:MAG: cyclic nucleotide-binding domain-containing protein [Pseudomonadota bacterium]